MSRRGSSGRGGSSGQVSGRDSGLGWGGDRGSRRSGSRGTGRLRGRNRAAGKDIRRGVDAKILSRQAESAPHLQKTHHVVLKTSMPASAEKEIEILRSQADEIRGQLQTIYTRISAIWPERDAGPTRATDGNPHGGTTETEEVVAIIDQKECINCGICAGVCPDNAITVEAIPAIDTQKCTGCGLCVEECPNKAIYLTPLLEAV